MRYCKSCGTEYRDSVELCADCGEPLVDEAAFHAIVDEERGRRERLRDVEMARACTVTGRVEAQRLVAALDEEGIPAFFRTFEETAFDGLFVGQQGWGEIWVAEERMEEAKALVEALRAAVELDEEGEGEGEGEG